jgi:Tol biopolymer transport system component
VSWFPGGTKLLISGRGGAGVTGIWTLATIGGEIRKIQDDIGEAALSPDGSRIVFEKQQELWQMGPNGENPVPLVQFPHGSQFAGHAGLSNWSDLAWSPDGRWLTYVRKTGETDPLVLEARLLEDGRTATILKDPDLQGYSWLSSTKIVLNRWETPDKPFSNLWHVDVDPKKMKAVAKPHRLTNWAGFAVLSMSATRDGNRLALTRKTDQSNILIGELADHGNFLSHLRRVSPQDRVEWPGGWSADGKALFFQSDRTGNMNIFRQRIDAANAEAVVTDQNDNRAPLLSPEKAWVLYFAWPRSAAQVNNARLMRRPVGGGSSELILEAKGLPGSAQTSYRVVLPTMTGQPAFRCPSQAGPSCVLSEAGPHEVVFYSFAPLPGAGKSEIFRIEASDPNALTWDLSPDGSRIAYAEFTWRSASIHVRELRANTTRDIALKGMTELSTLSWSADGKSFFATTFALTGSSLFHVTLDGKYRVLYKGAKEVEGARPSPDGRYLAFGDVVSASNVWLVEGFPK